MKTRLLGLLLIAGGLALGYFTLWVPLEEARAGVAEIKYSLKTFFAVPALLVFGPAMLVGGRGLVYASDDNNNLSVFGWILFAITIGLTAYGYYWFQMQFEALGYT